MKKNPIAVVDSGIGGSSILNALKKILPNENYIYYADTKYAPYGKRQRFEIKQRMDKIVFELITNYQIKCLVIGCNTASTIASKSLRDKYKLPIIAVEPPINLITKNKEKTLIMGTKHTIARENIKNFIKENKNCHTLAISNLAKLIDDNLLCLDNLIPFLHNKLAKYETYNNIVLGCTHYNFIKKQLKQVVPNANIISCEEPVARQVEKVLKENQLLNDNVKIGTLKIVMSKNNAKMKSFINNNYFFQSNNQM